MEVVGVVWFVLMLAGLVWAGYWTGWALWRRVRDGVWPVGWR